MTSNQAAPQRGFTLIEILVALMAMAVLSVLAYSAFDGILQVEARSKREFLQENRQQLALSILLNDLLHLRPRPARDTLGGIDGAYLAPQGEHVLVFTRGGLPHFRGMGGGLQRVGYRVADGRLLRTTWAVVDAAPATESRDQVLTTGVRRLEVAQLDSQARYVPNWPPANERLPADALPGMMRVTLTLNDGQQQTLLVPGPEGASAGLWQ